mmetsp:Transcript_481/g.2100  ORF Transcript_481/g.2100 Transcript_481/m.2100 type:complete len:482 (+) Transcript_481:123-1568(+)
MLATSAARWLPRDFVVSSQTGGLFTLLAYCAMLVVFVSECVAFLAPSFSTTMMLDRHDGDLIQINFDVDMYDIECRNLHVAVFAQGSEERVSYQDFWLRPIDRNGMLGNAIKPGQAEKPEDAEAEHRHSMEKLAKEDGKAELDSDWDGSHDGFNHKHFDHVIAAHDYTFINFFATWCSHCRQFAPAWAELAAKVNGNENGTAAMVFKDKSGVERSVRMIKMNCVDFQGICREKGIDAFPTLRLYKSDGNMFVFGGKRVEEALVDFITKRVGQDAGWSKDHNHFEYGCNAKGRLEVPRVPGRFELTAGTGDQNLNSKMTNVSHFIKHLSFSDPNDGRYHRKPWAGLPRDVTRHINPVDGQIFVSHNFHETWIHDLKVVSTVSPKEKTVYQFSHQKRLSAVDPEEIPQARFHFDIEPFSILIKSESKKWYDFGTSLLAIMGGAFVVMRLMSRVSLATSTSLQRLMKSASGSARAGGEVIGHFD